MVQIYWLYNINLIHLVEVLYPMHGRMYIQCMEGCKSLMNRCICPMQENVFVDLGDIDSHTVVISENVEQVFQVVD
jgi:hypothetical protein